jgi:predicted nuclease of predicted toxin-antitoxin system
VKLLIDMNLSPTWVEALRTMGCEAAHWSSLGDPRAPDREILAYASSHGYVIFTNDLDFGAILAARPATSPSVIQVRAVDVTPGGLAPLVREALDRYADWLEQGALVTVEPSRLRARVLPLKRS